MFFLAAILATALSPSPSPTPRLHTWLYARAYDARYNDQTDENAMAIVHAGYDFGRGFTAGGTYTFSDPNALAGLSDLNQIQEAFLAYSGTNLTVKAGDQYFNSPWADTHFKLGLAPTAFQGVDAIYARDGWTLEAAQITRFMSRTSSAFTRTNLLTGVAGGVNTSGFTYLHAGYAPPSTNAVFSAYAYNMDDMTAFVWFNGFAQLSPRGWQPFIGAQGGLETNSGASYLGIVHSSIAGLIVGATPWRSITLSAALDQIPWRRTALTLPGGASCNATGYFLPLGVGECGINANGTRELYYGGWASPYSDSYATDPMYTSPLFEGPVDRRSPGNSQALIGVYTSTNRRLSVTESYYWFDYSNPLATQATTEWDNTLVYYFSKITAGRYRGLLFRYGYIEQHKSNVAYVSGDGPLGGVPITRYSRFQLEYAL